MTSRYPLLKQKTGFNSYAICLDRLYQFEVGFGDEKANEWRLWCGYPSFKEAFRREPQMKDERKCPRCKVGVIEGPRQALLRRTSGNPNTSTLTAIPAPATLIQLEDLFRITITPVDFSNKLEPDEHINSMKSTRLKC